MESKTRSVAEYSVSADVDAFSASLNAMAAESTPGESQSEALLMSQDPITGEPSNSGALPQVPVDIELAYEGELDAFPLPEPEDKDEDQDLLGLSQKRRSLPPSPPPPEGCTPAPDAAKKANNDSKGGATTTKKSTMKSVV